MQIKVFFLQGLSMVTLSGCITTNEPISVTQSTVNVDANTEAFAILKRQTGNGLDEDFNKPVTTPTSSYTSSESSYSSYSTPTYSSRSMPYNGGSYNSTRAELARERALDSYYAQQRGDWRAAREAAEMAQVHAAASGDSTLYSKVSKYRSDFHDTLGIPKRYE